MRVGPFLLYVITAALGIAIAAYAVLVPADRDQWTTIFTISIGLIAGAILSSLPVVVLRRFRDGASTAPQSADVQLRVYGNTATEPWVRWYHVEAFTRTDVIARDARVRVRCDTGGFEEWQWAGSSTSVTIGMAPIRIPLVIGGVADERARLIAVGWLIELGIWRRTALGQTAPSNSFWTFQPGADHRFDVQVTWVERDRERLYVGSFELRFGNQVTDQPAFVAVS
jgi:hypothetical protein